MKNKRDGCPSRASKSTPLGTTIAARPASFTPADFACGVAIPSPSPVEPDSSRANTAFKYSALSDKLPPLSIKSPRV